MRKHSKLYIGTSGYSYSHWENGVFYPKDLPKAKELSYYAKHFRTVELNNPFYRLPLSKTFTHWKERVPRDFVFAVKVSRYITHIKYLRNCKTAWKTFLKRALHLENTLGPFLFQLPPNWKKNLERLKKFLKIIKETNSHYRFALEFRHPTWFSEDVYKILKKHKNVTLCIADSPRWPTTDIVTGNFAYIRMHGSQSLYGSKYSKKELKGWAQRIKKYLKQDLDVYVYFNNDAHGYAVENAKSLQKLI